VEAPACPWGCRMPSHGRVKKCIQKTHHPPLRGLVAPGTFPGSQGDLQVVELGPGALPPRCSSRHPPERHAGRAGVDTVEPMGQLTFLQEYAEPRISAWVSMGQLTPCPIIHSTANMH